MGLGDYVRFGVAIVFWFLVLVESLTGGGKAPPTGLPDVSRGIMWPRFDAGPRQIKNISKDGA